MRQLRETRHDNLAARAVLPQELTQVYAELAGLRLRRADLAADPLFRERLERLTSLATIYEAAVDTLAGALRSAQPAGADLLTPAAIHSDVAAPLLFLIAEQYPERGRAPVGGCAIWGSATHGIAGNHPRPCGGAVRAHSRTYRAVGGLASDGRGRSVTPSISGALWLMLVWRCPYSR